MAASPTPGPITEGHDTLGKPSCENTQAALWRDLCGEGLRPLASCHVRESLGADSLALLQPSDDCSPGPQHNCNLMRDSVILVLLLILGIAQAMAMALG